MVHGIARHLHGACTAPARPCTVLHGTARRLHGFARHFTVLRVCARQLHVLHKPPPALELTSRRTDLTQVSLIGSSRNVSLVLHDSEWTREVDGTRESLFQKLARNDSWV
ncbi:hypothetical protein FPV67DRAFT_1452080 [Lyophyllum atratum]|nr:hypothetical protein FPV67DRAFT_1452080 [Lyophyllum atratum]